LRPLEAEDAGIFYGREAPTIEVLDRLRGLSEAPPPRFFVVLGASGAGKSSFLRAGLVPRLRRDDRHFLPLPIVRPERAALAGETGFLRSLEAALRRAGLRRTRAEVRAAVEAGAHAVRALLDELTDRARAQVADDRDRSLPLRLVLPVDQGEELFLAEGADEARAFLGLIGELAAEPASNLIVLLAIRSDSFEHVQTAPALEGLPAHTVSLPPLPKGAYQTVIEGPAARLRETRRRLRIEPALTAALLADVEAGTGKDALPLLAFTLERLYLEQGGDGDLTLAEYQAIGGISGSIDAAVERALEAADRDPAVPRDRAARLALLRRSLIPWLAGIDPETGAPRRRVARLAEIPAEARPLVEHLIAARLLSTDFSEATRERTVEPAHEALLRQWGLLQGWLKEDFTALTTLEGVKRAARDWEANARHADWLAHSAGRREEAEALLRREDLGPSFDAADRAYLDACRAADTARRDRELEEARQLAEARRRVVRRTRIGLVAASVLAVVAVATTLVAYNAMHRARKAHQVTGTVLAQADFSEGSRLGSDGQAGAGLAYLARAMRGGSLPAAARAWNILVGGPWTRLAASPMRHENWVLAVSFSRDGTRIVTSARDRTARVWDVATGKPITEPMRHADSVQTAAFSPDGTRIVTGSYDHTARVWDAATGRPLTQPIRHKDSVGAVAFSADGTQIVTGSDDETARIWHAASGRPLTEPMRHADSVRTAAFSPDGARIVTGSRDGTARVWDAGTGRSLTPPMRHERGVQHAAFSADGTRIVTGSSDFTARVWIAATGIAVTDPIRHQGLVTTVAFSPDSTQILTGSWDQTARVWDAVSGRPIGKPMRHDGPIESAVFGPQGLRVLTASSDGTARVWSAETGMPVTEPMRHSGPVTAAVFSPDGARIATASYDGTARLWAGGGAVVTERMRHEGYVVTVAFSPDSTRIVTGATDRTARVWAADTGVLLTEPMRHGNIVGAVAFSPDGDRILTTSWDHTARIWSTATGKPLTKPMWHDDRVVAAAFSPDGTRIVTASLDRTARIWDAATGRPLVEPMRHAAPVRAVAFSPHGTRIVTGAEDRTARVWDVATGALLSEAMRHAGTVETVEFSPDGTRIVTGSSDRTARVWDATTGAPRTDPMRHAGGVVLAATFDRDGVRILTRASDHAVRVWSARSGMLLNKPIRHAARVEAAAFSPDGTRIVTGSSDHTAQVWATADGRAVTEPLAHGGPVETAIFSPDGTRVVTGSWDRTARVWDVPAAAPPPWAADLAEALGGYRLNDQSVIEPLPDRDTHEIDFQRRAAEMTGDDAWTLLLRWLFTRPDQRTISPLSKLTVGEFVSRRLAEGTEESLREALRADPFNAEVRGRLGRRRPGVASPSLGAEQRRKVTR
jgi:WD40 repeat protein